MANNKAAVSATFVNVNRLRINDSIASPSPLILVASKPRLSRLPPHSPGQLSTTLTESAHRPTIAIDSNQHRYDFSSSRHPTFPSTRTGGTAKLCCGPPQLSARIGPSSPLRLIRRATV